MTDPLQHDPRTKTQIKDALDAFLYGALRTKMKNRLQMIIDKNSLILGSSNDSFSYKGVVYSGPAAVSTLKKDRLSPQLHSHMDEYLKEIQFLNSYELPYVIGFITQVLNASNDIQDHIKVLPDAVHRPLEQLIATCPCRTSKLTPEMVAQLQKSNQVSIDLMKQRLVTNLIAP